jgi:hypothetical protein
MRFEFTPRVDSRDRRSRALAGALGAALAVAVALLPAGARAEVLTPHVLTPQVVTPKIITPPPTPTPAAPPQAAAPPAGGSPEAVVPQPATPPPVLSAPDASGPKTAGDANRGPGDPPPPPKKLEPYPDDDQSTAAGLGGYVGSLLCAAFMNAYGSALSDFGQYQANGGLDGLDSSTIATGYINLLQALGGVKNYVCGSLQVP